LLVLCLLVSALDGVPAQARPPGWPATVDADVRRDSALVQITRTMTLQLAADADRAFPLFGPVRESEWSPDWQPAFVVPAPGAQSAAGAVFTSGGTDSPVVWVMTDYDPAARIVRYVHTLQGHAVTQLWIEVREGSGHTSQADVTYRITALNDAGREFVTHFAGAFPGFKAHWEKAIGKALLAGR
jgi:hypothetical protein